MERVNLINNIKNKIYSNLYLVYGKETYLIEEIENMIKDIVNPDMEDFNLSRVDGSDLNILDLVSNIETLPFLSDYRVIIVKDTELFKGKKNISKDEEDMLVKLFSNMPNTTILLFTVYGEVDKRKTIVKAMDKYGLTCNMKNLDDVSLLNWCRDEFIKRDISITNSDIAYFIELSGYRDRISEITLSDMKNEIEKISSYCSEMKIVKKDDINLLMRAKSENDIFLLIDMISSKNSQRAMKTLYDMMDQGESIFGILAMLSKQFNQIIQVKYLLDKKIPQSVICENLKLHQFVFSKLSRYSKNFSMDTMIEIIDYISDCDYKIKQGLMEDNIAAEVLIMKFCTK